MIFMIQQFSKDSNKKILKLKDKKERLEKTKQKKQVEQYNITIKITTIAKQK